MDDNIPATFPPGESRTFFPVSGVVVFLTSAETSFPQCSSESTI
jgi:hypothetical protein